MKNEIYSQAEKEFREGRREHREVIKARRITEKARDEVQTKEKLLEKRKKYVGYNLRILNDKSLSIYNVGIHLET